MECAGMFWGVALKPEKRYEQVVEEEFRITKACVDPSTIESGKVTSVILETESDEFFLCNLSSPHGLDKTLDLTFASGESICFRTEGGATVHLTGYLCGQDFPGLSDDESEEEEEEEEVTPQLVKKRKLQPEGDGLSKKAKKGLEDKGLEGAISKAKKVSSILREESPERNNGVVTPKTKTKTKTKTTPTEDQEGSTKKKKKKNKNQEEEALNGKATPAPSHPPTPAGKTPKRTLKGGIVAQDIRVGNGPEAKAGKMVGMYYEGKLSQNGKKFDACQSGKPFKFKLGKGEVIKGWDLGVEGMKVGGKRRLTIPPQMAYGARGAAPEIPPNASLTFEVECKSVN